MSSNVARPTDGGWSASPALWLSACFYRGYYKEERCCAFKPSISIRSIIEASSTMKILLEWIFCISAKFHLVLISPVHVLHLCMSRRLSLVSLSHVNHLPTCEERGVFTVMRGAAASVETRRCCRDTHLFEDFCDEIDNRRLACSRSPAASL